MPSLIGNRILHSWLIAISGSIVWSAVAWFATAGIPLGELAKYFSHDVPDPTWFATVVPTLTRLARLALAILPWPVLVAVAAIKLFRRHFTTLNRPWPFFWVVAGMALLSFPPPIAASTTGLDQSWQWFLNHAAFTGAFGRDVVFTYGPLGFLLMPQLHPANALAALAANLFFLGAWSFCVLSLHKIGENGRLAAWLVLTTMFFPQGNMEWRWVALAALTVSVPLVRQLAKAQIRKSEDVILIALGGITLAVASLMKFSSLVTIAGTQVFAISITAMLVRGRARCLPIFTWGMSFIAVFSLLAFLSFDSFQSFFNWSRGSFAVADGYNKHFISAKSIPQLLLMPALLLVGCALIFLRARAAKAKVLLLLALSPLVFCTLKYGWTRQGPEAFRYVFCLVLALAVALSPNVAKRVFFFMATLIMIAIAMLVPRTVIGSATCDFTFGINPSGIVKTLTLGHSLEQARVDTARNIAEVQLPSEWYSRLHGKKVQFMPIDFAPAFGKTDFTMQAVPVLQLYSAYLPKLDEMCAAVYDQPNAPDYLVITRDAYWCGNFIRHPQTWTKVLSWYDFVAASDKHVLLSRRTKEAPLIPDNADHHLTTISCGEWVDCSHWQAMSVASWPQTPWGKLCTVFFRNTMTYLSLRYADGTIERIELNPATISAPWPLDRIALDSEDIDKVLAGTSIKRPIAVRFEVTTPGIYRDTIALKIQR